MASKQESTSLFDDTEEDRLYSLNLEWHRLKYILHQKASALTSALVTLETADNAHQNAKKQVETHEKLMAETSTLSRLPKAVSVSETSAQAETMQSPSKVVRDVSFKLSQQRQSTSRAEYVVEQASSNVRETNCDHGSTALTMDLAREHHVAAHSAVDTQTALLPRAGEQFSMSPVQSQEYAVCTKTHIRVRQVSFIPVKSRLCLYVM